MQCPFCLNRNTKVIKVSYEEKSDPKTYGTKKFGKVVECLDCGLRGPIAKYEEFIYSYEVTEMAKVFFSGLLFLDPSNEGFLKATKNFFEYISGLNS